MYRYLLLALALMAGFSQAYAQTSRDPGTGDHNAPRPYLPLKKVTSRKYQKKMAAKTTVDLQREYYERVDAVMKQRKKAAKIMQKPQYSDPMYFGHKRPPKKRPPQKMKFCKECGIRH